MNLFITITFLSSWAVLASSDHHDGNLHRSRRTRSPAVEIVMHLPPSFSDIDSFRSFLGLKPERRRRDVEVFSRHKREVELTEENQGKGEDKGQIEPVPEESAVTRMQRDLPESVRVDSAQLLVSPMSYNPMMAQRQYPDAVLELVDRGGGYRSLGGEPDDLRKRRNTSANDHEDKRAYPEPGRNQDGTTAAPFWKQQQKKSNPPFITAREGRQNFEQPQHRNLENSRESHSLKDGKSIASNEIPRMSDSYYSASDSTARAYTPRQGEAPAPKSVYDTIDYTSRRPQGRNIDSRGRLTSDVYNRPYDRYYYPLGSEIAGRGVEYYHRSLDPGTGRVIYYASLPEPDVYRSTRTYAYDSFGRSFPSYPAYPNYPYQYQYNPYSPYQQYNSQDFSRSSRYQQQTRIDEPKNKTYVILDAEESTPSVPYPTDRNRYDPPLPYPSFQPGFRSYQPLPDYNIPYNTYSRRGYQDQRGLLRNVELPLTSRAAIKPVST